MKLRTVLVEDSRDNLDILEHFLKKYCPEVEVVGTAATLEQAEREIRDKKPELVFFDIVMGGGSSFDLLEKLEQKDEIDFLIVFVSAHSRFDYAEKAIDYSAIGYLTKPIDKNKLILNVRKALRLLPQFKVNEKSNAGSVPENPDQPPPDLFRIFKVNHVIRTVRMDEVSHIVAEREVSHVFLKNNEQVASTRPLAYYQEELADHPHFFRIHNNTLLNILQVSEFNHRDNLLILRNGTRLNCSRRMGRALFKYLS